MSYQLAFTDIGEGLHEAEILKWFIQVGDTVEIDQPLVEVQTDKAAVEITSPKKGMIKVRNGEEGDTIVVGDTLVEIALAHENNGIEEQYQKLSPSIVQVKRVLAAPSVRKFAREKGIDLTQVNGSEKGGRITKQDVLDYIEQQESATSVEVVTNQPSSIRTVSTTNQDRLLENEVIPIRGVRKQIYKNMVKSAFTIPHVTAMEEFHAERLVQLRNTLNQESSVHLTYLPIIMKFVIDVLKNHPIFNAFIDEEKEEMILKKQYNIGVAMATPKGLLVPVVHDADKKSIEELAQEIMNLQDKALSGKLTLAELQGGTFTISNTGSSGGYFATPIINYPEVAILGIHSIKEKPVILPKREIGIGHVLTISLSFDHRIIDGEHVGYFMNDLKKYIENPESWFLKVR